MTRLPNGPARPISPLPDDEPPEEWDEEVTPEDRKSPMLNDRSAEPLLPVGEMSSDTPKLPSEERKIPSDAPVNPYIDPDMPGSVPQVSAQPISPVPDDEPPEEWDEVTPADPKDPLPADDAAEPGIPTKEPSPDTTPN